METETRTVVLDRYQPGTYLVAKWGYDQTNADFYMITRRSGDWLWLEPRETVEAEHNGAMMTGKVMPSFRPCGAVLRRKIKRYATGAIAGIPIKSYKWAQEWHGGPVSVSYYG